VIPRDPHEWLLEGKDRVLGVVKIVRGQLIGPAIGLTALSVTTKKASFFDNNNCGSNGLSSYYPEIPLKGVQIVRAERASSKDGNSPPD
jgi:hypothetical protein